MSITRRVLIADDEPAMRTLLADLLRKENCEVIARAENGAEAIELYREKQPDIIFLDINMPEVSGIDALKQIREEDKGTFICMVSGDAYPETVKSAVALGVSGFVVKPLSQSRIHDVISSYLEMHQQGGEED